MFGADIPWSTGSDRYLYLRLIRYQSRDMAYKRTLDFSSQFSSQIWRGESLGHDQGYKHITCMSFFHFFCFSGAFQPSDSERRLKKVSQAHSPEISRV